MMHPLCETLLLAGAVGLAQRDATEDIVPRQMCGAALLRAESVAADRSALQQISLPTLWSDLVCGKRRLVDGFFTQTRCGLVLGAGSETDGPLSDRNMLVLEAMLKGDGYKVLALDMGVAISNIATNARWLLSWIGAQGRPSRVHPMLMLIAAAARREPVRTSASMTWVAHQGTEYLVIGMPRQDLLIANELSGAVTQVLQGLFEGFSYAEIAEARSTSIRTVANQAAVVFRHLRVSGRNELVQRLLRLEGAMLDIPSTR